MPLSEFYESINGKNESQQPKSSDISYIPNDEFVELIWEKGQIMMQGQSSKAKKTPVSNNFQFHTPKLQDKDGILDLPIPELGLNQDDDDMVPWLNYPLYDYSPDLLPEISGVTVNEPHMHKDPHSHSHTHTNFIREGVRFDQSNTPKVSRNSHLFSWSLDQVHTPDPTVRSGVTDIGVGSNNCRSKPHNVIYRESAPIQGSLGNLEKKVQKQNAILPYSASTLLNFSHFSKPAAVAKANHGTVVNHGPQKEIGQPSLDPVMVGSKRFVSKPLDEPRCTEKPTTGNDKSSSVVVDANTAKGCPETVKSNEQVGATSSVCSGNSAERASNDLTKDSKRKTRDTEDFECQSQDVDEELLATKTAGGSRGGTGSKRSRAAEVHNMSERRRRDRINEKMRALQELIPNCNKVDKASMLDEAIEYLKTLQLQVQIMSMGSGLCMPPMMFPPGMQHMHPHFSPMGIGMGMGYGMGMDMNGGPQGHSHMFPFPPNATQGSRHPPPIYGHPSQGMQMLFPQQPMPGIPVNPAVQQTDVPPSSKEHHAITQTSNQPQVANKSLVQATLADKKDQCRKAGSNAAGVD